MYVDRDLDGHPSLVAEIASRLFAHPDGRLVGPLEEAGPPSAFLLDSWVYMYLHRLELPFAAAAHGSLDQLDLRRPCTACLLAVAWVRDLAAIPVCGRRSHVALSRSSHCVRSDRLRY